MSVRLLTIKSDILGLNEQKAQSNRRRLEEHRILMVNIMSSPGSGKTSLILRTVEKLKGRVRMAVIEGDIASTIDADAIARHDIPAIQINTAGACHLDANMIEKALDNLELGSLDLIFIENVGNLICPAGFALGEQKKVMLLSVPEGDDKPHKYPPMFMDVDVVVVNKIDVLPHFDFRLDVFTKAVTALNPKVKIFPISAKTGEGLESWLGWLEEELGKARQKQPE